MAKTESTNRTPGPVARRLAMQVYDAYADDRRLRDVPLWLTAAVAAVAAVLAILGNDPWRWLLFPVVLVLVIAPVVVRWAVAMWRTGIAFREGIRGE